MLGIYIHVPFCLKKCPYCDFYSLQYSDELCENYVKALCKSILNYEKNLKADTIYFGGGTPNLLKEKHFEKILNTLNSHFSIENNSEISIESNPALCNIEKLKNLRKMGINRISIGVQSFDDIELKILGRLHDSKMAKLAVIDAQKADFSDISVDFMMCLPNQNAEKILKNLNEAKKLPITHISAYMLKIEENTPFSKMNFDLPSEDEAANIYLEVVQFLEDNEIYQYEISNFSKSGFECKHNLKYWKREEYLGFGPAAHSFYQNKRFAVQKDLNKFLNNPFDIYITDENCDEFEESLMLNLRLTSGFDTKTIDSKKAQTLLKRAQIFEKYNYLNIKNGIITLTKSGFLLSNSIISDLLYNM